jgi:hypothetical protein
VLISESTTVKFLCRFLNRQEQSFWAADFIDSGTIWLSIYESVVAQFSLPISKSAATQFVAADF